jgi:uncharacterized SAM-binding protein YcdF (DUF218 family)
MRIYFEVVGIICLLYYSVICLYTRKFNSTFALFWPAFGGIHILLSLLSFKGKRNILLWMVILLLWAVFLAVEIQICTAMAKRAEAGLPYIIVLGAQVRGTRITNSLMRRLDAALCYLKENSETNVIVSGGQGKGEDISEASAMAEYLHQHGIADERIVLEDTSRSTWENLQNSGKIIDNLSLPVGVVTNDFHMYRALQIGRKAGFTNIRGIVATSNPVLQLNYLVREFFAVIWMKKTG